MADPNARLVMAMQALLFVMLISGLLTSSWQQTAFFTLQGVLVLAYLILLGFPLRKCLDSKDVLGYSVFFLGLLALIEGSVAAQYLEPDPFARLRLFSYLVIGIALFLALFEVFLRRHYTTGSVLFSDEKQAAVHVNFDLLASVSAGNYVVETLRKHKKGDNVRLLVKRKWFKRVPFQVMEKE